MSVVLFSLKGGVMLVRQKAPTQIIVEYIKGENPKHQEKIRKVELAGPVGGAHAFRNKYRNVR